jgi:hypothetical protein
MKDLLGKKNTGKDFFLAKTQRKKKTGKKLIYFVLICLCAFYFYSVTLQLCHFATLQYKACPASNKKLFKKNLA